jgi:hypothetical protein
MVLVELLRWHACRENSLMESSYTGVIDNDLFFGGRVMTIPYMMKPYQLI